MQNKNNFNECVISVYIRVRMVTCAGIPTYTKAGLYVCVLMNVYDSKSVKYFI